MLMRAKVPKAWSILLSGVVIGLIEFLIGAGWAVAVGFIAGAIIAELLARIGHYKSFLAEHHRVLCVYDISLLLVHIFQWLLCLVMWMICQRQME